MMCSRRLIESLMLNFVSHSIKSIYMQTYKQETENGKMEKCVEVNEIETEIEMEWVVCVCVCERERKNGRENKTRI